MEGDNSHVEMKLSSDVDEEAGGNGVGEHLNHSRNNRNMAQKPGRPTRNLVILGAVIATFFCLGEDSPPAAARSPTCPRRRDTLHNSSTSSVFRLQTLP